MSKESMEDAGALTPKNGNEHTYRGSGSDIDLMLTCADTQDNNLVTELSPLGIFSKLPAEIRLVIYEYAAAKRYTTAWVGFYGDSNCNATEPAILRVSSAIRKECLPVFYQVNTFHMIQFRSASDFTTGVLLKWLRCIGESGRGHAKEVVQLHNRLCWCHRVSESGMPKLLLQAVLPTTRTRIRVRMPKMEYHVFDIENLQLECEQDSGR